MARFGPIVCTDMGVPHEWGIQASAGPHDPSPDEARAAAAWCSERSSGGPWRLCLPGSQPVPTAWVASDPVEVLPMYAVDARHATALDVAAPPGVLLDHDPSVTDVLTGYGAWMDDDELARLLTTPADLRRPDRGSVVARLDGEVVGCAFAWWAGGTGYLSGIGVRADCRGRGIGRALTASAAQMAGRGARDERGEPPDVVWMHATAEGAALYGSMGFVHVDDVLHVHATPA